MGSLKGLMLLVLVAGAVFFPAAAEASFCGVSSQSPQQIQANATKAGFKRIGGNARYVAYSNPKTMVTLTFTTPANKAHPAVACRHVVEEGGAVKVLTEIRCVASRNACKSMQQEFSALDAQMRQALEKSRRKP
jgi:N-acetylglutamate synthase/N-acetylornithine aminotransferase